MLVDDEFQVTIVFFFSSGAGHNPDPLWGYLHELALAIKDGLLENT